MPFYLRFYLGNHYKNVNLYLPSRTELRSRWGYAKMPVFGGTLFYLGNPYKNVYLSLPSRTELRCRWGYAKVQVFRGTLFYLGNRVLLACVLIPYLLLGPVPDKIFLAMMLVMSINRVVNLVTMEVVEEIAKVSVTLERIQVTCQGVGHSRAYAGNLL